MLWATVLHHFIVCTRRCRRWSVGVCSSLVSALNHFQACSSARCYGTVGYVLDSKGNLVKVRTKSGLTMAGIAVSLDAYRGANCTTTPCTDRLGAVSFRSEMCSAAEMVSVALCASEAAEEDNMHGSMWATGGNDSIIPVAMVRRHAWPVDGVDNLVCGSHTVSKDWEPAWNTCVPSGGGWLDGDSVPSFQTLDPDGLE
ncbi:TPA: hypothetical protein N0F65_006527 [Lagenidium giganteum]|uniref:Uncharacterized protein n=1 Tax=Lagenidium giganteum TaxID=4803 RepID=A0AAV2YHX3_9STRA|nr:TPA: hypothetical protein N0F65_006527 [Lagenidium giganteum]